jgi:hypothetical protein
MDEGAIIFTVCSVAMLLAMFFLPGVGGGHVAPPPPRKRTLVDRYGLPIVCNCPEMPPVKQPRKPFFDAVMPDRPWPRVDNSDLNDLLARATRSIDK